VGSLNERASERLDAAELAARHVLHLRCQGYTQRADAFEALLVVALAGSKPIPIVSFEVPHE
jgi:hypothetical protein